MIEALVPSNHSPLEHALAEALAPLGAIDPAAIETLWNAWRCPAAFLPFLAYALSVDFWDDGWDEIKKREIIAASPAYHRRKGTRLAVEQAAAATGRPSLIAEWWQFAPPRRRGTFSVSIGLRVGEAALPAPEAALLRRFITSAKPKSRTYTLSASHHQRAEIGVSVRLIAGGAARLAVPPDALAVSISPRVVLRTRAFAPLEVT